MINKLVFLIILVLAAFLRIWQLDQLPPSLNWDEASLGYNAYSILRTGKDEWGEFLPLTFRAYGDYKLPGFVYLTVPFIAIFGLNEWAVRLPSAALGIILVGIIFYLVKELIDEKTALWSAVLLAILPWAVILSRIALEAHVSLFLTTLGVYFYIKGIKDRSFLLVSAVFFGLTIFFYNSSRVVTPLLIFSLGLIYRQQLLKYRRIALISVAVFLLFFTIALPKAFLQDSSARYKWTTILDQGAINRINELRGSSALPQVVTSLTYNKVTFFIPQAIQNYFSHFNPDFLFLNGGSNFQFSVPGTGLIYPVLAPFFIYGIFLCLKERKNWQKVLLSWLLISFLPAAVTRDAPHALRSLMAIIPIVIISAYGVVEIINKFPKFKIWLSTLLAIIILINLGFFWQNYSDDYKKNYSWSWQYGYKQVVEYIKDNNDKYDKIYITKKYGEPHEFLLFYLKFDPQKYFTDPNLVRFYRSDWYWVDQFDKYYFVNDWEIKQNAKCSVNQRCLLVTSPGNFEDGQVIEKVKFLNDETAFEIVEI